MIRGAAIALLLWATAALPAAARDIRYPELVCVELTADAESQAAVADALAEADFAARVRLERGPAYNDIALALCGVPDPACVQHTDRGAAARPTTWVTTRGLKGSPGANITLTPANYEAPRLGIVPHRDGWMAGQACMRGFRSLETDALAVDGSAAYLVIVTSNSWVTLVWSRDEALLNAVRP